MNKIQKFIKDNHLDLDGTGSDLNSNCVVLAGFACYLGIEDIDDLYAKIEDESTKLPNGTVDELDKVFSFAKKANYGSFWKKESTKKMYKY